jgi:asparagine synthase (glutamine-hydrolysing)
VTAVRPIGVEVLANHLLGMCDAGASFPTPKGIPIREALGEAMVPALQRTPCVVSFSGGRDSSAVLAVAVDTARRLGLAEPIPVSMRFRNAPETDEREWQQLVVDHLGVKEHVVLELEHELDALGAMATKALRGLGLFWPGNAYMHLPVLEVARGGAVLTGVGGDELFETRASLHLLAAARRERPSVAAARSAVGAALPRPARAMVRRRRFPSPGPWLTRSAASRARTALARDDAAWPSRWDRSLAHWYRTRSFAGVDGMLPLLGELSDVLVRNPFLDPAVLAEVARVGGSTGFDSRTAAMDHLVGALLPGAVVGRRSKATFAAPIWGPAFRDFAQRWTGAGADPADVDIDALRREWLAPVPSFATILLLHQAWLAAEASSTASS